MEQWNNEISIAEAWLAIKTRRTFIIWLTVMLVLATFVFTLFSAGGVNGSFTGLVTRLEPVAPSANPFDKDYDTFYALRAAEAVTKTLVVTLRDPAFQASFSPDGRISARVLAPSMFKVNIRKARDERALNETSQAIVAALNERLKLLAGQDALVFQVQAADFEGRANRPNFWPNLLVALAAGLGFGMAWVLLRQNAKGKA